MKTEVWNKDSILSQFSNCENLRDIINSLEEFYSKRDLLVCEIRINGMLLEEDDEARFAETPISEINEVSVATGTLDHIIYDIQSAMQECLPSLQDTALRTSEYFRGTDLEKAQNSFSALLEGCQWFVDTLMHIRKATDRMANPVVVTDAWKPLEKGFSASIRQILMAFQNRDYTLLADLLEYELTSLLESWMIELSSDQKPETRGARDTVDAKQEGQVETSDTTRGYEPVDQIQDTLGGR